MLEIRAPAPGDLDPRDFVVRETVWGRAILALILLTIGLGWFLGSLFLMRLGFRILLLGGLGLGAFVLLITALLVPGVLRGFTRPHWVLRVRHQGVLVDLRSYLNAGPERGPSRWLFIPRADLTAVQPGDQTLIVPHSDKGSIRQREFWIDLHLTHPAPPELVELIESGRARGTGTHHHVLLASLIGQDVLRIHWRSPTHALRPSLKRTLARLSELADVLPAVTAKQRDWELMDEATLLDFALELEDAGRRFEALAVLRKRFGWSLSEAREFLRDEPRAA